MWLLNDKRIKRPQFCRYYKFKITFIIQKKKKIVKSSPIYKNLEKLCVIPRRYQKFLPMSIKETVIDALEERDEQIKKTRL